MKIGECSINIPKIFYLFIKYLPNDFPTIQLFIYVYDTPVIFAWNRSIRFQKHFQKIYDHKHRQNF